MKKIHLIAAIVFSCLLFKVADAQIHVNIGVNIGSQPDWGPVGYTHADYYYMPDIDAYYDVPAHQYVYYNDNVWIHGAALPPRYHFDRYHTYKVVVNQRNPWERNDIIRTRYANYRGRYDQELIRESHDERYRNHWKEDKGDDRGREHDNRGHGHDDGEHGHGEKEHGHGNKEHGNRNDN